MQCYTELIPPSGVTSALALPFTSSNASNLIVARTSLLQVFALKQINHGQESTRMVLLAEYQLSGTITSLGRVRILNSRSGGEAVLVALRNAKLSLIEWDPQRHSICTISIHYYESENLQRSPWVPALRDCVNHLTVDPSSRCAVFHFGKTKIAVIPFHQSGDDLIMDEYDADFDQEVAQTSSNTLANGDGDITSHRTPYGPSFVLPLTALHPGVLQTVHLAFLFEYREPTFGILYSTMASSSALGFERKDVMQYAVFTLDLDRRASTLLLSILNLPNDLFTVVPLPLPVGGALLVGSNELIHVDQSGKTNSIGVNEFARRSSSFPMADLSELRLRLEGCQLEQLDPSTGDTLIVLADGSWAVLTFRLDGRSVSGMSIRMLPHDVRQNYTRSRASCIASVSSQWIFLGSDVADSILLSPAVKSLFPKRHGSKSGQRPLENGTVHASNDDQKEEEEDDDEDEDDLYGDSIDKVVSKHIDGVHAPGASIRLLDRLPCLAPLRDVTIGRSFKTRKETNSTDIGEPKSSDWSIERDLVTTNGHGPSGGITLLQCRLRPKIFHERKFPGLDGVWSFPVRGQTDESTGSSGEKGHDKFIILSLATEQGQGESKLFEVMDGQVQEKPGTDFDPSAGGTIECGSITNGSHIVQILEAQITVFDQGLGLVQIWQIVDEDTDAEAKAISASFADPYILVLKDDSSILLLKTDQKGELDEFDLEPDISQGKYASAVLYYDSQGIFTGHKTDRETPTMTESCCIMALLSQDGSLSLYTLSDLPKRIFHYEGAHFLPPLLSHSTTIPRQWKGGEVLSELLVADLGDSNDADPHLILRTTSGETVVYKAFSSTPADGNTDSRAGLGFKNVQLRQTTMSASVATPATDDDEAVRTQSRPMRQANVEGLFVVMIPGQSPAMIARAASSSPHLYNLSTEAIVAFSGHHSASCLQSFMFVDTDQKLVTASLPEGIFLGYSDWVQRKVDLNLDVRGVAYLERTGSYVLASNSLEDCQLPQDDEWHPDWKNEDVSCMPQVERGMVKLVSSTSIHAVDSYQLDYAERAMCIKSMNLEVSEETHERKDLIVVGTAITRGEDVLARGTIYIFDVVDVVPQPGVPETDLKLKLIAKEEVKGAVTSLSEIGSQGFMLAAQGQKCMVRGLKEDLTILPVAFMDMKYYVNVAKELAGTGLCILGDAISGLWFVGYSEEPYRLQQFGRDQLGLEVIAADFLPDGKSLYIIAADGDGDFHVMQFDPESPESERGTKLLHRSTFSSGSFALTMTLLPQSSAPTISTMSDNGKGSANEIINTEPDPEEHVSRRILVTSQEGSIALISSLPEQTYRRLLALQNILAANLEHACGLNPRAYRVVETDGVGGAAMIDGNLVRRWLDQDRFHQASTADKVGSTVWEIRDDLTQIGANGLLER